jgi:hypothetical protein
MEISWYYAHGAEKNGPYTPREFRDLARAGTILPTDTVWKSGIEEGVLASRVRNLFAPIVADVPIPMLLEENESPTLAPLEPVASVEAAPPVAKPTTPAVDVNGRKKHAPKGVATALAGAIIVSQDGTRARYRMVCKTCGHQDSSCQSLKITNKTFKRNFYCPKCRKRRDVSIQCQLR